MDPLSLILAAVGLTAQIGQAGLGIATQVTGRNSAGASPLPGGQLRGGSTQDEQANLSAAVQQPAFSGQDSDQDKLLKKLAMMRTSNGVQDYLFNMVGGSPPFYG